MASEFTNGRVGDSAECLSTENYLQLIFQKSCHDNVGDTHCPHLLRVISVDYNV